MLRRMKELSMPSTVRSFVSLQMKFHVPSKSPGNSSHTKPLTDVLGSPEAFATIYRFSNALDKAQFYEPYNTTGFSPHGDVFSCKSDKKHGQRRRITSNIYSMTNVAKSEEYINSCSDLLTERLGQFADSGKPCDIGEWLHW
jgi:hypothetical protein